jgi:hypothetical protein
MAGSRRGGLPIMLVVVQHFLFDNRRPMNSYRSIRYSKEARTGLELTRALKFSSP